MGILYRISDYKNGSPKKSKAFWGTGRFKVSYPLFDIILFALYCLVITSLMYGCAPAETARKDTEPLQETPQQVQDKPALNIPEITSLEITEQGITVTSDKSFEYSVYKPSDPFRVTVEIRGVTPGSYAGRTEPKIPSPVTEVKAVHIKSPVEGTRLDILLSAPEELVPEYTTGKLLLKVKVEEAASVPLIVPEEEPVMKEDIPAAELLPAQYIENVSMERKIDSVVVTITGDGKITPDIFPLDNRLVIDIPGVDIRAKVPDTVIKPLRGIRWAEHEHKTRIVLDLDPNTFFDVVSIGEKIEVSLRSPETVKMAKPVEPAEKKEKVEKVAETKEPKAVTAPVPTPEELMEGRYTGRRVSLDFQDADIIPIFRLLADVSGYNFVIDPKVRGKITMKLINVPWDQALDIILKIHGLSMVVDGNIIRIAPVADLAREKEEIVRKAEAERKAEPLVTKVFPISYAGVGNVKTAIEQARILSDRGTVSMDERISSLIVKDIESNMPKVEELIATLDKPTPQVMIEARIVEVNTNVSKDFGIQWGIKASSYDNLTRLGGLSTLTQGASGPYMIDLPSGAGATSGTGINFGFMNAARTFGLDLQLSAIEDSGHGKIISNPRIITLDNAEAMISQGDEIPYRKITAEGTVSEDFKPVTLELRVTPHITPDKNISMKVSIKKDEADYTRLSSLGTPAIMKKEANTNIIIKNGETFVVGGIYKKSKSTSEKGLPVLMDIPILGYLFKGEKIQDSTTELLIFITPRIIEKPADDK